MYLKRVRIKEDRHLFQSFPFSHFTKDIHTHQLEGLRIDVHPFRKSSKQYLFHLFNRLLVQCVIHLNHPLLLIAQQYLESDLSTSRLVSYKPWACLKQAQGLRRKNGHFHQTSTHFSLIQTSQIHIHEKTEQHDFFMPLTSHQIICFRHAKTFLFLDPGDSNASRWFRQRKTYVFPPCPYRTDQDRSPGPIPFRSPHVTSLFHADI